mgnify:CR=1 FL=1
MRQIVLDTETTGLEVSQGHRIIEIGCVELQGRKLTGRHFHRYINPERDIDAVSASLAGDSSSGVVVRTVGTVTSACSDAPSALASSRPTASAASEAGTEPSP